MDSTLAVSYPITYLVLLIGHNISFFLKLRHGAVFFLFLLRPFFTHNVWITGVFVVVAVIPSFVYWCTATVSSVGVVTYNKSIFLWSCLISELAGGGVWASSVLWLWNVIFWTLWVVRWGTHSGFLSLSLRLLTVPPERCVLPRLWPRLLCGCTVWLRMCVSALFIKWPPTREA